MKNFVIKALLLIAILLVHAVTKAQINTFPYSQSFENTFGVWTNEADDDMDWQFYNAASPSGSTGPSSASAGSYYIYVEASASGATNATVDGYPTKRAYLQTTFDFTGEFNPSFTFDYHMYGAEIGTLYIDVHDGSWNYAVWSLSGEQQTADTDAWITTSVDLSDYENRSDIIVRIRAITGEDYTGDIAVDNISVCTVDPGTATISTNSICSGSGGSATLSLTGYDAAGTIQWEQSSDDVTYSNLPGATTDSESTDILPTGSTYFFRAAVTSGGCTAYSPSVNIKISASASANNTFPDTEGFESGLVNNWVNVGGDVFDWTEYSGPTPSDYTGPSAANGGSNYVYTESSGNYYNSAFLEATYDFTSLDNPQLIFSYHMYGIDLGDLYVDVNSDQAVWSISGQQQATNSENWTKAYVDLSAYAGQCDVTLRLRGVTGEYYRSDIAIDDILVWNNCTTVAGGSASISDASLCAAGTVDLSLVGQDGGATMQWQQSTDNVTFSNLLGATSANFTTASLSVGSTYYYRAELTNACVNYSDTVSVAVNNGGGGISTFPYSENFDAGLGTDWINSVSDDFDWDPNTGATNSASTGPSDDNGGGGQYIYTEASDPNNPSKLAYLEADFDFTGINKPIFSFYYHMFGGNMGILYLDANGVNVGSISYQQQTADTDAWRQASFDLSDFANECSVTVRLRGQTGTDYQSDMAVDDILLCTVDPGIATISDNALCADGTVTLTLDAYDASATLQWQQSTDNITFTNIVSATTPSATSATLTAGNTYYFRAAVTNTCTNYSDVVSVVVTSGSGLSTFPYSESFEAGFSIWTNSASDNFDWSVFTGETTTTYTGPISASTGSQYAYIDSDNSPYLSADMSAEFDFTSITAPQLSFYYHMYGSGIGTLSVDVNGTEVWTLSGKQQFYETDPWEEVNIDLSAYAGVCGATITFKTTTEIDQYGDISIDDISICAKPSTTAIVGNSDVCTSTANEAYSVTNNVGNTYTWYLDGAVMNTDNGSDIIVDWGSIGYVGSVAVLERSDVCEGDLTTLDVNIHTLPTSGISGNTSVSISTTGVAYTVDNNTGYTYAWTINGGAANPASTTNTVTIDWNSTEETGDVSVIATDASRACSAASSVILNVTKYSVVTSTGSGDWNTAANWSCNCIPSDPMSVQILSPDVITLSANATVANLVIDAGAELDNSTFSLTASGDYSMNGIHSGSGAIILSGTDTQIDGTGTISNTTGLQITGGNKTIISTAVLTLSGGDFDIAASNIEIINSGSITISNGSLIALDGTDTWTNTATGILSVNGDLLLLGALDVSAVGNTVTYGVAGAQTIKVPSSSTYYNLILSNSGVKSMNGNIIVQNDLTISDAAELDLTASNYDINLYGDWTNSSSVGFTERSGAVNFLGTGGDQNVTNTNGETFFDMTVNNSSGDVIMAASSNITITNSLTLTDGLITPNTSESVTFIDNATVTSTVTSYINGQVIKIGNDAFVFPLGNGGRRGQIGISAPATSVTFAAQYFLTGPSNSTNLIGINHISAIEYWELAESVGSEAVFVTLYWDSGTNSEIPDDFLSTAELTVAHYTGANWINEGGTYTGLPSEGTVTSSAAISTFSPFTLGANTVDTGLPVELLSFSGSIEDDNVVLNWATASELNNDYFEIERSADGKNFSVLSRIEGNGTINERLVYSYTDVQPYYGIAYYRLKQVDYDGATRIYPSIAIDNTSYMEGFNTVLYPNPADNNNVSLKVISGDENSPIMVNMYDVSGKKIYSQVFNAQLGESRQTLGLNFIESGIYQVVIQQGNNQQVQRLIIK